MWDYINGKPGDMVRLFEKKKRDYPEKEALSELLKDEIGRLEWIKWKKLRDEKGQQYWNFLKIFKQKDFLKREELEEDFDKLLFWVDTPDLEDYFLLGRLNLKMKLNSKISWLLFKISRSLFGIRKRIPSTKRMQRAPLSCTPYAIFLIPKISIPELPSFFLLSKKL